nr:hypothetical protein Iba_scaffold22438CG0010 [Ipomoea batatas]
MAAAAWVDSSASGGSATGLGWREQLRDVSLPLFSTNTSTAWAEENGGADSSHFTRCEEFPNGAAAVDGRRELLAGGPHAACWNADLTTREGGRNDECSSTSLR